VNTRVLFTKECNLQAKGGLFRAGDQFEHLSLVGKPSQALLGEYEFSSVFHLKHPAGRLDQLRLNSQGFFKLYRQTGGLGSVVSRTAIGNFANLHVLNTLHRYALWIKYRGLMQRVQYRDVHHDTGTKPSRWGKKK
jgi:hypothetical protein